MLTNWYSYIYNTLIVVGIIIVLCTISTTSSSSLTGTIIGLSFIITGTFLLMGYLLFKLKTTQNISSISSQLITVGPFFVLIGILIYMVYLLSLYFNQITNGNVPNSYYSFINLFAVLLIVQMFMFYKGTQNNNFQATGILNKVTGLSLYFMEIFNIIIVITLGLILKYFSTDG
jgi:hypothetical protein